MRRHKLTDAQFAIVEPYLPPNRILTALQVSLDQHGLIDWDQWWVDSTNVRASRAAAGARKKDTGNS